MELNINWCTRKSLISHFRLDPMGLKQRDYLWQTAPRQSHMLRESWPQAMTRGLAYVESRII